MGISILRLTFIIFALPFYGWSQGPGQGVGFSPSADLATMTCPFTDAKEMKFKEDNDLLVQMKGLESKLKEIDARSSACSKMVGPSIGTLINGLISLKNANDKKLPDVSMPSPGPEQLPLPVEDCVRNPRLCVSAVETLSQAVGNKDCKNQAGDILDILTEVSLKLAGTAGNVAILGVTAVSAIARTTLDSIKNAKRGEVIKLADKITYQGYEEKLKQLSSCFAFSLYEDISCRQYGINISKPDPKFNSLTTIFGENKDNPLIDKIMVGPEGVMFKEPVDFSPEMMELLKKINTVTDEFSVSKQSREIERIEASSEYEKIMTYASSYLVDKIEEGMEHLKNKREIYDSFMKKKGKKKYKDAQISNIDYDPSPMVYQNLIRNCYSGRAFLVNKGDLEGQLSWSKKCGKLDQCIDKIHKAAHPKLFDEGQLDELHHFVKNDVLSSNSAEDSSDYLKQHCYELFQPENDVFSYKSFNRPSEDGEILTQESQCFGTKSTYEAVNNTSYMARMSRILKAVKFDHEGNCDTSLAGITTMSEEKMKEISKATILSCKNRLIDLKKQSKENTSGRVREQ